jgi:hypothetical protein
MIDLITCNSKSLLMKINDEDKEAKFSSVLPSLPYLFNRHPLDPLVSRESEQEIIVGTKIHCNVMFTNQNNTFTSI